jgi:hypothetical protein
MACRSPSRTAWIAGRSPAPRRIAVKTRRAGASGYRLEVHVIVDAPGQVRNQRHGMSGLDQPQVEAQVGGLEADVGLEAGGATLCRAPLARRTTLSARGSLVWRAKVAVEFVRVAPAKVRSVLGYPVGQQNATGRRSVGVGQSVDHREVFLTR